MALNTVSSDRLSTNVKNTNFTAAEKQDLTDDILPLAGQLGNRNLIINGAMQVAQRGTSFTVSDAFTLDRYKFKIAGGGAATITQSSTTPDDFSYSYKVDITTADTSVASTDHGIIMHVVEGYNFAPANFGSSAAKTCKLSFYVRSNKTGTYGVAFQNAAQNRSCIQEYTINSADTWERKTITVPGDTGGSWNTTNGVGLKLTWGLMGGSTYATSTLGSYNGSNVFLTSNQVNLFDNTSNEWYMTGAQLEIGSVVTDFEHRSVGQELALCQRYYAKYQALGSEYAQFLVTTGYSTDTDSRGMFNFQQEMRSANPSFTYSGSSGNVDHFQDLGGKAINLFQLADNGGTGKNIGIRCIFSGSNTSAGFSHAIRAANTVQAFFAFDAEL